MIPDVALEKAGGQLPVAFRAVLFLLAVVVQCH